MGALVTVELPADSRVHDLPWIITFGPLEDDDDWEPVVCGPYERLHALSLAEHVVADEDLMAVVEPVYPSVSVDEIREDISAARLAAEADEDDLEDGELVEEYELDDEDDDAVPDGEEPEEDDLEDLDLDNDDDVDDFPYAPGVSAGVAAAAPTPAEIRAGFLRIAARLTEPERL